MQGTSLHLPYGTADRQFEYLKKNLIIITLKVNALNEYRILARSKQINHHEEATFETQLINKRASIVSSCALDYQSFHISNESFKGVEELFFYTYTCTHKHKVPDV